MAQITIDQKNVKNIDDVRVFFRKLYWAGINFHPDDTFLDTINHFTKEPTFSEKESERLDLLMDKCFEICNKITEETIYEIGIEEFEKWEKNADKEGRFMLN